MSHGKSVNTIASTPDNRYIFMGSGNTIIKLDRRTGEEIKRRENAHESDILALVTDGTIVVSCDEYDRIVKVWSMDLEPQQ